MRGPLFYAKILLFGEYGIIKNSKGLSIPFNYYKGSLKTSRQELNKYQIKSNKSIRKFLKFLRSIDLKIVDFEWNKIDADIENNIYFDSSIPQGYGIGSSGALVAALYERYAKDKIIGSEKLTNETLQRLKIIFSKMESFFHGRSSGLDPLSSYLRSPILIDSSKNIELISFPSNNIYGNGAVFLIDSGNSGNTESMVNLFFKMIKNESFKKMIKDEFINITNQCVDDFLEKNYNNLFLNIKNLSKIVFKNFNSMIPERHKDIWLEGINSNSYFLKLCGSGGGGYFLGFTQNWTEVQIKLSDYDLKEVYRF